MMKHKPAGRAASNQDRTIDKNEQRKRILIVCEGEKTEPNYFLAIIRYHRLNGIVEVKGTGLNTQSLVDYAKERQGTGASQFDEIWCVFDKDSFPPDHFDNAISTTSSHKYLRAAWTNEAFELWYILHFEFLNTSPVRKKGTTREYYKERLSTLLKKIPEFKRDKYYKNDPEMYLLLGKARLQTAIANALKLCDLYNEDIPFHQRKPATQVHELVQTLLSYAPENP